jgi:hypothetical protein
MNLPSIKSDVYGYEFVPGDVQELVQWCRKQADFYNLVIKNSSRFLNDNNLQYTQTQCAQLGSLQSLADYLEQLNSQQESEQNSQRINEVLSQISSVCEHAINQFQLPPADSEVALNLKMLMEKDPSIALPALFALTRFSGYPNNQFTNWFPEIWRGMGIGALLSAQHNLQAKPEKYAKAYRELVNTAQAELGRTRFQAAATLRDLRKHVSEFKVQSDGFSEAHSQQVSSAAESIDKLIERSEQEIEKYKFFVKQEIALKAPVTYWETKAAEHENQAFGFGIAVIVLMFLCGVGAFHSLSFVKELVGEGGKTNYAGIAVVAVLVTLVLWMLRLVVRIFLSQQHLGADARERTAMVKTYLALKEAGVAPNNGDLTPVLVALFRPSSDGIVKDEAMPPVLAEILTRTKN